MNDAVKNIPVGIPPSCGGGQTEAIISASDYERVAKWKWSLSRKNGYACRNHWDGKKYKKMYMHRYLMDTPDGMDTDHINRNKLDNRRCNLRVVDRSANNFNTPPPKNNTSGHKGVSFFKPAKLWRAYIRHQSEPRRIELGYFKTKEEAIAARIAAEERLGVRC
jgi:hypothetical protein